MNSGPTNHTPPSGDSNLYDRKSHLRVVATPELAEEVKRPDSDPAGMGSQDIASLLRADSTSPWREVSESSQQPISSGITVSDSSERTTEIAEGRLTDQSHDLDARPSPVRIGDELGAFELAYADGSTAPLAKHGLLRRHRRHPGREYVGEPDAAQGKADAGGSVMHHDDEPMATRPTTRVLMQQCVESPATSTRRMPSKALIALAVAVVLVGSPLVAGLVGKDGRDLQAAQTVVQTVTTPVIVTQTTAATTTTPTRRDHRVKKHPAGKQVTKSKTTARKSMTTTHASTTASSYTARAYTAPASTQPAPNRSASSESGSASNGGSASKSSSSSKSSSPGSSLSAGQQAQLNPS